MRTTADELRHVAVGLGHAGRGLGRMGVELVRGCWALVGWTLERVADSPPPYDRHRPAAKITHHGGDRG